MQRDPLQMIGDIERGDIKLVDFYNGSGAAIVAGNAVQLDTSVTSVSGATRYARAIKTSAASAAGGALVIGGAYEAIADGAWGRVQVEGVQTGVNVATSVAAGDRLCGSAASAGRLKAIDDTAAAEEVAPIAAIALTAESSNTATVRWCNPHSF